MKMKGIKRTEFDNGLILLTEKRPTAKKAVLLMGVRVGSIDENDKINGASHFNEHMLFKSNRYRSAERISEDLEYAGTVVNAYTSWRYTAFHAKALSDRISDAVEILFQGIGNFNYEKDEFLTEKDVILTEIHNYINSPERYSLFELFIPALYRETPLERTVIGTENSVKNLTKNELEGFKRKFYAPNNMVIVATGKFNDDELLKRVKVTFGKLKEKKISRPSSMINLRNKKLEKFEHRKDISQLYMSLGYKVPGYVHEDIHRLEILSGILAEGFSSRMLRELREKRGIGYDVGAFFSPDGNEGIFSAYINGFDPKRFDEAIGVLLKIFESLKKNPVPDREFNGIKNLMISKYNDRLEKIMDRAIMIFETELYGIPYDFRKEEKFIREISKEELMETANKYLTEDYTMTVLGPE